MTTYTTHTLPNGLRIIHLPQNSPVAYCGFATNAGTRDELEQESGMAHFVEHLLFKGTTKRKAWHILNRMERVGGDLNAYTNKEETVVYSAFLKEHFVRAADLLADILFRSTFPQNEMEKEVEVILDEIQSYEDSPSELIFDDFEELIFPNHPLGRNILGTPDTLKSFTTADVKAFTERYYRTGNTVFFVQGDIPFKKVVQTLEKVTSDIGFSQAVSLRQPPPLYKPQQLIVKKDTNQAHVMVGNRGYDAHSGKRTALYLLNNLLGGPGMNSRLNVSLRERRGLVYNVEANLTSYTDTGLFAIYFGTDPSHTDRCLELVYKELKLLCDTPLSGTQLAAAQKQLIGQIGVASDNFENNALGIGKAFLHYGRVEERADLFKRIESLTPEKLWEVANEVLVKDQLSTLIYQ
ncbi:MAG: M16 family metallopeptidase [Phocaeicola sp.]